MWSLWLIDQFRLAEVMLYVGGGAANNQPVQDKHGPGARVTWLDADGDTYICHGRVA